MAKRRRSGDRANNVSLPKAAATVGFTESEKAFFAVGDDSGMLAQSAVAQAVVDEPKPSLWRRLFPKGDAS